MHVPSPRRVLAWLALLALAVGGPTRARAQDDTASDSTQRMLRQFESSLTYRTGTIILGDSLATLSLPEGYTYLGPRDADRVLQLWGNPPGSDLLGMILPGGATATGTSEWAVILSLDEDGYVKDDDARSLDFNALLRDMQADTREENAEREDEGYPAVELLGWAAPPHYDAATHKLYWAKVLRFGTESERTLNYNIRVLGRRGVLVLNAVAALPQLPEVERGMQQILGFVDFNPGHRYADYVAGTDKVAAYGIGALVAGKLAAKAGLFKVIVGVLVAMKKLVPFAIFALVTLLLGVMRRRKVVRGTATS